MNYEDLTKEYLVRTFDFKNNSPSDFVQKYFEILDETKNTYNNISNERKNLAREHFYPNK